MRPPEFSIDALRAYGRVSAHLSRKPLPPEVFPILAALHEDMETKPGQSVNYTNIGRQTGRERGAVRRRVQGLFRHLVEVSGIPAAELDGEIYLAIIHGLFDHVDEQLARGSAA